MRSTKESIAQIRKALEKSIPCGHLDTEFESDEAAQCPKCGLIFFKSHWIYFKTAHMEHFEAIELLDIAAQDLADLDVMEKVKGKMDKMPLLKSPYRADSAKSFFMDFPNPHKIKALTNTQVDKLDKVYESASSALFTSFSWVKSPEGVEYWSNFYEDLVKLEDEYFES